MKKDIGIWILLSICLIITIIILIISFMTTNIDRKFNLIKDSVISNKQNVEDEDVKVVLMSFTNNIDKAKVFSGIGFSLEDAFSNVKKKVDSFIEENNYDVKFLKADIVTDIKDTTYREFEKEIEDIQIAYSYRRGLILENTDGEIVFLTEAELNANNIIDYKNYQISLFDLNKYLDECNKNKFENLPNRFRTFSTISYFCDDKNNLYEIDSALGYRKQEVNKQEIRNMINLSSDYLSNLIDNHGKYIYGYYPQYDKQIASYNILRHAGSTWSLIINTDTMVERQKIESTLDYIATTTKYLDNETGFVQEYLENAAGVAMLLNSGKMPIKYTIESERFVKPIVNDDILSIAIYILLGLAVLSFIYLIIKYKKYGALTVIGSIAAVDLLLLVIRYTNVYLSIESAIAFIVLVLFNIYIISNLLKGINKKSSKEEIAICMKKGLLNSIDMIVVFLIIAVIFTFMTWSAISNVG